ncbi:ABC transporter permease [Actinoplanes flavus]|uniref:ABC transporter permease n=1 Tax=Actinoplanes flavus TaxID=2820290 RepID=A0ABS3UR39_9ACTN|nr:ABC transporter permease [Actinoplanes flavus]MBO3741250.1 ABC transporter permease [Actinoplanes flavus]
MSAALLAHGLRRERAALPWWIGGTGALFLVQSTQSQELYGDPAALARLRETVGANTAVIAMSGPPELLTSIGGEIVFEIFGFAAVVVALMNMFLIGRHTRGDEETGRAELLRSTPITRRTPVFAALRLAVLADLVIGAVVFAALAGTGLPPGGSLLVAAATAALGLFFAALTVLAAQVFEHTRAVYAAVGSMIGAAWALRAVGDTGAGAVAWLSPIGWGQRTWAYGADRWWPLAITLGAAAVLVLAALAALDRRDVGAGLLRSRPGRPYASRALGTPSGLAWRLQRGLVAGWAVGVGLLGVAYGSIADSIEQWVADNPETAAFLSGGAGEIVDSFLALSVTLCALLAAAAGVAAVLRARAEELAGRAEPVLATATSRAAWLGGHLGVALAGSALVLLAGGAGEGLAYGLTVGDPGQALRMAGAALAALPGVWAVVAVAVFGLGWAARAAAVAAWSVLGYCVVVQLFAASFGLPSWAGRLSPFAHLPRAPLEAVTAGPVLAVGAVAAVLVAGGLVGFRRRDVGY